MTITPLNKMIDLARIAAIIACVGLLYSPTVASIGLIAAYVAFLASGQAVSRFKQVLARPLGYWGVVFLGIVVLGMAYASASWSDRWMDLYKWRTILWFFVMLAIFDETRWKDRLLVMFIIGTAVGVIGSIASAIGWVTLWRAPHVLLRNPATQGMAFACATLGCVWIIMEKKPIGPISWIWPMLGVLYVTNIIFITDSRSGYAVLGLGLSILLSWKAPWKYRVLIIAGLLLAGGLALALSPRMQDKVGNAINEWTHESELQSLTSFGIRRVWFFNTLEIASEHWLFGLGTGGFPSAYREYVAGKYIPSDWRAIATGDPHNQYLAVFVEHGIGGLIVFLGWLIVIGRDRVSLPQYRGLAVAILYGWCVTSFFSSHFRTFAEGHLIATFLGALLAIENCPQQVKKRPADLPSTQQEVG